MHSDEEFEEFSHDFDVFVSNLYKLSNVTNTAPQTPRNVSLTGYGWDLNVLFQICGDFRKTLEVCSWLLINNPRLKRDQEAFSEFSDMDQRVLM